MTTYHNIRIPVSHNETYERLLALHDDDKAGTIAAALDALAAKAFPPSALGFVKIIPADIDIYRPEYGDDPDRAAHCPACEEPLTANNVYLAFHSDNTFGLICGQCVADYNG